MPILKRGLPVVLFLPCFILCLLFRYARLLVIFTGGFTTTLILVIARALAFVLLIYPTMILATEELRVEWVSQVTRLLFRLIILSFRYLTAWNGDLGSWLLDFSDWLSKVPSKLQDEQPILCLRSIG